MAAERVPSAITLHQKSRVLEIVPLAATTSSAKAPATRRKSTTPVCGE